MSPLRFLADGMQLGAILERTGSTVFVRGTGPASEVRPQRAAFEAFCKSLEPRE